MDIILGYGLDLIPFGITDNEACLTLGEPDKIYFTDCNCKRLQYNEILLELSFEPENEGRLGWIEVHNPRSRLFGIQMIGKPLAAVEKIIKYQLDESPVIDDYGSFISVNFENHWLELQFEFDKLISVNFGVLYDANNEALFPPCAPQ